MTRIEVSVLPKMTTTSEIHAFSPVAKYTFPISDSVALSVHLATKPHNMKVADLKKGLIFVYNGGDVVGEGTGFGVPILKYSDETFFFRFIYS